MTDHCTGGTIKHEHVDGRCPDFTTVTAGKCSSEQARKSRLSHDSNPYTYPHNVRYCYHSFPLGLQVEDNCMFISLLNWKDQKEENSERGKCSLGVGVKLRECCKSCIFAT